MKISFSEWLARHTCYYCQQLVLYKTDRPKAWSRIVCRNQFKRVLRTNPLNRRYSGYLLIVFTITVDEVRRAAVQGGKLCQFLINYEDLHAFKDSLVTARIDKDKDTLQFSMLNYDSWDRLSRDGGGLGGLGGPYPTVLVQGTFQMAAGPGQLAYITEPL
jgi:hypothetical protein